MLLPLGRHEPMRDDDRTGSTGLSWGGSMRMVAWSWCGAFAAAVMSLAGCDGEVTPVDDNSSSGVGAGAPSSTSTGVGGAGNNGSTSASKLDVLLVVDNSRLMNAKQAVLADAVPDLVQAFVNPPCVDAAGTATSVPASPSEPCPAGLERRFAPVLDMHLGVISSSIGGHGADTCPASVTEAACGGAAHTTNDDKAHLLSRTDPCTQNAVPTYQQLGFLAWDPNGAAAPPGDPDPGSVTSNLADMVRGVGAIGCGFEAPLEAMFRFLADPSPYAIIGVDESNVVVKEGVDDVLLQQRMAFLRPDSALAIIVLSDENDCSIIEQSSYYLAAQAIAGGQQWHLPRARQACAVDPGDACCASCGQATPSGCAEDPTCDQGSLPGIDDPINLRCFDQKRRFGIDFLYPIERYVNALTQPQIDVDAYDLQGSKLVPNPIFSDLANAGSPIRGPSLVFLAGIVGVPWQLVAKNPSDLSEGFKPGPTIDWQAVLGDPATFAPPLDPHMIESIDPRPGLPMTVGDPIHGGEWTIPDRNDLQYACTFDLLEPRDCTVEAACDCTEAGNDNPLCAGPSNQVQVKDKAYPGLRTLSVLRGLGAQGVVASICPALQEPTHVASGYRPAVRALVEAMRPAMAK
jgi:hypothetical protein